MSTRGSAKLLAATRTQRHGNRHAGRCLRSQSCLRRVFKRCCRQRRVMFQPERAVFAHLEEDSTAPLTRKTATLSRSVLCRLTRRWRGPVRPSKRGAGMVGMTGKRLRNRRTIARQRRLPGRKGIRLQRSYSRAIATAIPRRRQVRQARGGARMWCANARVAGAQR